MAKKQNQSDDSELDPCCTEASEKMAITEGKLEDGVLVDVITCPKCRRKIKRFFYQDPDDSSSRILRDARYV